MIRNTHSLETVICYPAKLWSVLKMVGDSSVWSSLPHVASPGAKDEYWKVCVQGAHSDGWQFYAVSLDTPPELWTMCCPCGPPHRQHGSPPGWWVGSNRKHSAQVHDRTIPASEVTLNWLKQCKDPRLRKRAMHLVPCMENHWPWRLEDAVAVFGTPCHTHGLLKTIIWHILFWIQLSLIEVNVNGKIRF